MAAKTRQLSMFGDADGDGAPAVGAYGERKRTEAVRELAPDAPPVIAGDVFVASRLWILEAGIGGHALAVHRPPVAICGKRKFERAAVIDRQPNRVCAECARLLGLPAVLPKAKAERKRKEEAP